MSTKPDSAYRWLPRYVAAVAAVGVGLLLRLGLTAFAGEGLPPYITFYPVVMVVALLGGFGPGLVATITAALVVDYCLLRPVGHFGIANNVEAAGLAFFSGMGLFMSIIAGRYGRARLKAAAYDQELALGESRRQNELLASVIEHSSQPFGMGYPDGRLGLVNRAFEQLTGYSAEELRILDWAKTLTAPEWAEVERRKLEELQATGQPVRYEKEYIRKDGTRVPIELLVHLARDAEGKPQYYYSFLTDITERKRAAEAEGRLNAELRQRVAELRSAAEQRRLALEAADLGAWDYHFQTGSVSWDERCLRMWGFPPAETINYADAIAAIHPEDRAGVDEAVKQALAGKDGGAYHREFRVVWPDGSAHWIASHGRVYFEGEGDQRRAIRFIGANREITREKQAQDALRESEERLAAFAVATFEGIVLSEEGRIVDCNEQLTQMLRTTRHELKGRNLEEFIAPEDRQRVMDNIQSGREAVTEHQMLRADGSRITVEAHGRPRHPARRGLRHTAIRDVTERKEREEQLRRLNRTLRAHSKSDQALVRATSEVEYLEAVCRIVAEDCGHAMVWIGFAEEDEGKTVRPAAQAGFEEGYLGTLQVTWANTERGRGPTGTAIRTGQPSLCRNMLTDPAFAPWRAEALKRGYASSLVLPLLAEGRAFGALTIYSGHADGFSGDEARLLTDLASDTAYGIMSLRFRAAKERAEVAMRQSEERYRGLVELSPEAVFVNRGGRIVLVNPAALQLFGASRPEQVLGKSPFQVFHPDCHANMRERIGKVLAGQRAPVLEEQVLRLDGTVVDVEVVAAPMMDQGERAILVLMRDITERKRAAAMIARLASFPELNLNPIVELGQAGQVDYVNPAARRLFPDLPARGLQHPWLEGAEALGRALRTGERRSSVREVTVGDRSWQQMVHYVPEVEGVRIYGFEISERKRAEVALQQTTEDLMRSNRDLEQFAYVASHDLQEPLRAVGGYVKLLQHRFPEKLDDKARGYIAGAFEGATRMERLITDLLAFSRVGTQGGNFVPADLNGVLEQAQRNLATAIQSSQAKITHDALPTLPVDATQIMQLFQNLIGNALKFHGQAPPGIHVSAAKKEGRWVIAVRDNGIGIEPQYYGKIFHIFQRLHTRRDYPGTGIGLAICKRIVERHGGTIWVESEPGQGSTFYFSIPDTASRPQP